MPRVMVIVLDGASFVFTNTFIWDMDDARELWHRNHRCMMYIDEPPITPAVLTSMFTGKPTCEHGVKGFRTLEKPGIIAGEYRGKYIWDELEERGFVCKVINVPVKIPPVYRRVDIHRFNWVDCWLPPKDRFLPVVTRFHNVVCDYAKRDWDLFVVWYPIPDQAHHHFFQTIDSDQKLREACFWYNLAFKFAKELIELGRPTHWLIVSDHGFTSDFEEYWADGIRQHVHIRDGLTLSNIKDLPDRPRKVYHWIKRRFRL